MSNEREKTKHCWKDFTDYRKEQGHDDVEFVEATCLLENGHSGEHQWTRDNEIAIAFDDKREEIEVVTFTDESRQENRRYSSNLPFAAGKYVRLDEHQRAVERLGQYIIPEPEKCLNCQYGVIHIPDSVCANESEYDTDVCPFCAAVLALKRQ